MDNDKTEMSLNPQTAFYILMKARVFDEKVPCTDPASGSNATDDKDVDILEDMADDPTLIELGEALDSLNEDAQVDLLALIWTGRGDFSAEEWEEARRMAADARDENLVRYVVETPLVSDYLEEGLSVHGYFLDDYEKEHL